MARVITSSRPIASFRKFLSSKFQRHFGFKKMSKRNSKRTTVEENEVVKPRRSRRIRSDVLSNVSNAPEINRAESSNESIKPVKRTRKKVAAPKTVAKGHQRKINICCVANQSSPSPSYSIVAEEESKPLNVSKVPEKTLNNESHSEDLSVSLAIIQDDLQVDVLPQLSVKKSPNKSSSEIEELVVSKDLNYLITDEKPPLSYYKDLIARRIQALEITLAENEQLSDRIAVAATENVHLHSVVDAGVELARDTRGYCSGNNSEGY